MVDKKLVGHICAGCTFSPFKKGCPRGDWNKADAFAPVSKYGKDKKCPVMQFEAEKPEKKRSFLERSPITRQGLLGICAECQFSEVRGDTISFENCFEEHCMDCICSQMMESLEEAEAECRSSY